MVIAYLGLRRLELYRRNRRSWEAIAEKLQPGSGKTSTSAHAAADLDKRFTNEATERHARSAQGRREMHRGAGAMMEMADYAERNGGAATGPAVASLRSHAVAIRRATAKDVLANPGRGRTNDDDLPQE